MIDTDDLAALTAEAEALAAAGDAPRTDAEGDAQADTQTAPSSAPRDLPVLLSYQQASERLGISRPTLYTLLAEGAFAPVTFGKRSKRILLEHLHIYAKRAKGMSAERAEDPATPSPLDDELLTYGQACDALGVSLTVFRPLVKAGLITPVVLTERTHRFCRADVVALIQNGTRPTEKAAE